MPHTKTHPPRTVPSPGQIACILALSVLVSCDRTDPGVARGRQAFARSCAACHGTDAAGLEGLGANLRTSEYVGASTDAELIEMIKAGKDATDTHPAMPAKGGVPTLTDERLADIVAYIRSLRED